MNTIAKGSNRFLVGGFILVFSLLAISHAGAQTCVQPSSGLVSWWPGDGNADDSVDNNHGMRQNGATFAPGMVGEAFTFDGVDDYIEVPHHSTLAITGTVTIEFWAQRQRLALTWFWRREGTGRRDRRITALVFTTIPTWAVISTTRSTSFGRVEAKG